jgi:cell division protein FtsW
MNNRPVKPQVKTVRPLHLGVDVIFIVTVITILVVGLMMMYSASWKPSLLASNNQTTALFFLRQLRWAAVGIIVTLVVMNIDYRKISPLVLWMMVGTVALLLAVLAFGEDRFNSRRSFFNGSLQPSELAKLVIIIYLSYWLFKKKDVINDIGYGLIPMGLILALVATLIMFQPDLSAAITVVVIGGSLFFLADVNLRQIVFVILGVGFVVIIAVTAFNTGKSRLDEYKKGLIDPIQSSEHIQRSVEAVVRGGVFGVGIGKGSTKFTGLPVSHTDSIFAVIVEETGLIGAIVVVGLYLIFFWRGMVIASRAHDLFGKLLASGMTIWITAEAILNMGVMVNVFPFAGNALPLMSAGGSSLVTTLVGIGIILSVGRVSAIEQETKKEGRTYSAVVNLRGRNRRWSVSGADRPANPRR